MAKNPLINNQITWCCFNDFSKQSLLLAQQVADDITEQLLIKERVVLSVPGGTTPSMFLHELSCIHLDWSRVCILLNDERWVPLNDQRSNEAMIRHALQCNAAKDVEILSYYHTDVAIDKGLAYFNQRYFNQAGSSLLSIDICVLGMGEDGHMASLFPNMNNLAEALDTEQSPELIITYVPDKELRVSLNLSALLMAKQHYILIKGQNKKRVLERACIEKTRQWPVSYLASMVPMHVYYSE